MIVNNDITYDEYVQRHDNDNISMNDYYERDIHRHFKSDIMYVQDVQKIIFNADGSVRLLDRDIYDQLQKLSRQFHQYMDEVFDVVDAAAENIRESS